jgi:hypothetical protein
MKLLTILLLLVALTTQPAVETDGVPAEVQAVMQKAGIDVWPSVERLQFTFVATFPDRTIERQHDWNLVDGTATIDGVTISPWSFDETTATEEAKAAFAAWTNDGYWLLIPLKLGDPGVNFGPVVTTRDQPASRATVTMSFDDGTGLTPGDEYDLAIDLQRDVIDAWTYRPNDETSITWNRTNFEHFNGLLLSTLHESETGPTIRFADVEVTR